jgi:putative Flp pilus-assembly TadE/G-like protein
VLVKFAFLLIPLLLMTGLSVDVGYWYSESSDMQKAADAAALAGVVWLPDVGKATEYAKDAAAENGYPVGGNISMTVTAIEGQNRRLKVVLRDNKVGSFFYRNLGGRTLDLKRTALAEYILPVPLGSPLNYFGGNSYSDPTAPSAGWPNLWGNIHGPKTDNVKGDAYAPSCRNSDLCSSQTNDDYRPEGYLYTIDIPANLYNLDVQIFDAGLYDRGADESVETGDRHYAGAAAPTTQTRTVWTMYGIDPTPADTSDLVPLTSSFCSAAGTGVLDLDENELPGTYKGQWRSICRRNTTITAAQAGRYYLRVQTLGNGSGANRYALRVLSGGTTYKARIAALGDMSMYNNVEAGDATFYLAEVGPEHKGKILELNLYDPGEVSGGNGEIQVIAPSGSVATSCRTTSTNGALTGTKSPCKFISANNGTPLFNGAWVTLQIDIPTTYSCTLGVTTSAGCWWKIKYVISGQGNDTTTWSANIIGDPVHLVEEEAA